MDAHLKNLIYSFIILFILCLSPRFIEQDFQKMESIQLSSNSNTTELNKCEALFLPNVEQAQNILTDTESKSVDLYVSELQKYRALEFKDKKDHIKNQTDFSSPEELIAWLDYVSSSEKRNLLELKEDITQEERDHMLNAANHFLTLSNPKLKDLESLLGDLYILMHPQEKVTIAFKRTIKKKEISLHEIRKWRKNIFLNRFKKELAKRELKEAVSDTFSSTPTFLDFYNQAFRNRWLAKTITYSAAQVFVTALVSGGHWYLPFFVLPPVKPEFRMKTKELKEKIDILDSPDYEDVYTELKEVQTKFQLIRAGTILYTAYSTLQFTAFLLNFIADGLSIGEPPEQELYRQTSAQIVTTPTQKSVLKDAVSNQPKF